MIFIEELPFIISLKHMTVPRRDEMSFLYPVKVRTRVMKHSTLSAVNDNFVVCVS
jgi:hypothetical protein